MLLFKRNFSLSIAEHTELKKFVSKTIESLLRTKEETLNIYKRYDLVLLCSLEGNYLVVDIYELSKFALCDKKNARKHNIPFYRAAFSLAKKEDTIIYIDIHKERGLRIRNLQAFYSICELIETMDIEVVSLKEFKCIWQE